MRRRLSDELVRWKQSTEPRHPVIISGARQTGKTWLLRNFGARHYKNTVHISLDINPRIASYFEADLTPQYLIRMLEAEFQTKIEPGRTLLIFDEIQSSERALTSLKYFSELAPEYHVAAAGSLLGVAINREKYSFPVGQVRTLDLYPLDFEEFLWAQGDELLAAEISESFQKLTPLPDPLHQKAITRYREYLVVGGMPACVSNFIQNGSVIDIANIQSELQRNYVADMAKYASQTETVKIRACYASLPAQLGKDNHKFQYKIVRRGGSAALFGSAIEWLVLTGIVLKCRNTEQGNAPLPAYEDLSSFKLFSTDTGLLSFSAGLRLSDVLSGAPHLFQGALAENYVAQQLAVRHRNLFYWTSGNTAEVDFVIQTQDKVHAIEVKSGENTRSRSLNLFQNKYTPDAAIRLSLRPFGCGNVTSIPLYAAHLI